MPTQLADHRIPAPAWPEPPEHRHLRDCWWDVMRACWTCAPPPAREEPPRTR